MCMETFFTFHKQTAVFLFYRLKYEISPQTTCTVTNRGWAVKKVIAGSECHEPKREETSKGVVTMVCGKRKLPTVILPVMELTSPDRVKQGKKRKRCGQEPGEE